MEQVETIAETSPWTVWNHQSSVSVWNCQRPHCCYFCGPDCYEPLPPFHTLCARCGAVIRTPGLDDPRNESMTVCPGCSRDLS